jgi:hypothetical protein
LNSLIVSGCNLIYAAGDLPTNAINKLAPDHPNDQFLPIANLPPRPNLTPLTPGTPDQVRTEVRDSMTKVINGSNQR